MGDTIRVMAGEQAFCNPLPYNGHDLSKGVTPFDMREADLSKGVTPFDMTPFAMIRCGTCGNSDKCDYLAVGSENSIAAEYETITDELGFLVSKQRTWRCRQEKYRFCTPRPTRKHGTKVMTQVSALRQRELSPCRTSQR